MRKVVLVWLTLLLCCCNLRKKEVTEVSYDSLSVQQQESHDSISKKASWELEYSAARQIEIYATAPYRWHPDSGLAANAGYLKVWMSERSAISGKKLGTEKKQSSKITKEIKKVNVTAKRKAKEFKGLPFNTSILLAAIVLMALVAWWLKRTFF